MGPVAAPWLMLQPRRFLAGARLLLDSLVRIGYANVLLAVRIWRPSRPLRSGMVVVPTRMGGDAELGALGLITSLIVDNQVVDVDRSRRELQLHAISVPQPPTVEAKRRAIEPTERRLAVLVGPGRRSESG
jgi:multicomponent Na+:H+ antiporter subunit E